MYLGVGYDFYGVGTLSAGKIAPGSWDGAGSVVFHGVPLSPQVPPLPAVAVG